MNEGEKGWGDECPQQSSSCTRNQGTRVEVVAGGVRIPLWASAVAGVVTGGLAILLWREGHR
jgi:hypothetical protein